MSTELLFDFLGILRIYRSKKTVGPTQVEIDQIAAERAHLHAQCLAAARVLAPVGELRLHEFDPGLDGGRALCGTEFSAHWAEVTVDGRILRRASGMGWRDSLVNLHAQLGRELRPSEQLAMCIG